MKHGKSGTGLILLGLLLGILVQPTKLLADGVIIPPTAYARVQVPEQQALIQFADGQERLVIQTSFIGEGTNFAWIVPLPSAPAIEQVSSGFFPTLQFLFRPKTQHNVPQFWAGILALFCFIGLVATVKPTGGLVWSDVLYCLGISVGLGALSHSVMMSCVLCLALLPVANARRGDNLVFPFVVVVIMVLVIGGLILPARAHAGISTASASVQVLERKVVGIYDTATLRSTNATALSQWLSKNGFATPTNLTPVIRDYIREGWVFVATKVAADHASHGPKVPHPLMFTFKTSQAVYPLRLTGAGHGSCRVDLYVFGAERAAIPGFSVVRCEKPSYDGSDFSGLLVIKHPGLGKVLQGAPVATKLTASLSRQDMEKDAWISFHAYRQKEEVVYSAQGAAITSANVGVGALAGGLLILGIGRALGRITKIRPATIVLGGIVLGLATFAMLPQVKVHLVRSPHMQVKIFHQNAVLLLKNSDVPASSPTVAQPTLAELRQKMADLRDESDRWFRDWENPYTGRTYIEQDSPGNFLFREGTNGIEYVWYNLNGAEVVQPLFK